MPTAPIKFVNNEAAGDSELAGASPFAYNVLMDGQGAVRRRPGISAWSGFPSTIPAAYSVDGMGSLRGDLYYVNSLRQVHKVVGGVDTNLTAGNPITAFVDGAARPVFAETKFRLVISGGGVAEKVDVGSSVPARLGGSPPNATQIIALSSRLMSNDKTGTSSIGQIRYSTTGSTGEELWDPLNFIEAEARPDDIVALRENTNEAFAFGETSLQVFAPDPSSVLAPGRTKNLGCAAAYSVVRIDEQFAWLDNQRRFVLSDGRDYQELSEPIAQTLDRVTTASDAYGFRYNFDQFDCLVWLLPTDGRGFAWQKGGGWAQWQSWDASHGYMPLPIRSHYFLESQNLHLVGLSTGQIAKLDTQANTDLGATIKAEVVTGFENRGTDAFKQCECLRLTMKRGQESTTAPVVRVSWRDDLGAFCAPLTISLGVAGDYVTVREIRSLGTYRRRQWKFEMTDAAELLLAAAEEVFTIDNGGAN